MIEWFKHTPRTATPTSTARPARAWMMPLEPRIMFDAAAAVTVAEALHGDDSHAAAEAGASDTSRTDASVVPATRQDIVFIDAGVRDIASLLGSIRPEVEVHVVQNGLTEIAQILANRQDVDSVQIISHGQANAITLSGQVLHAESLAAYASELQTIGAALAPQGDILLYGCNTGAVDTQHADFVIALAAATGKDVAASTDNSGSAQLGGDWVLERHTGTIETGLFASSSAVSYGDLLAAPTSETFNGVPLINGNSLGTVGSARVINGWTFSLLNAAGTLDPDGYVDVTNQSTNTSLADDHTDSAASLTGAFHPGTGQAAAVLAATTGEEFAFQSIVVEQFYSGDNDYRLVGYRDGNAVSGATQDFTAGAFGSGGTLVTVSGSAWQNLDAVRIVRQGGDTDISIYVDDITVAAIVRPTATVVVADTALAAGETSLVTFTFSQAVTGFTNGDLSIANGSLTTVTSGDGGVTWTATFTPTASITDSTNLITVNMAGVNALSTTVAGTGTQSSNNYAIDTARPTATLVMADTALRVGETSGLTITFSEAVTGFTNADLTLANGTLSAVSSGDGGITWTATFTPTASLTDATNVITLDNTGVTDAAGNAGSGTTDSNNYAIDTVRPTASIVVADSALLAGETSLVTITFSEAVTGFTNADLAIANGTLSAVSSSDGGITWTATLTPTASLTDATNVITLANTGVTDAAGNAGTGTTNSNNYTVSTVRPTASIVVADTALAIGETSLVTITFSEAVTGFTNADLTVANGTLSAVSSSDGGITWTATFTPTASITDATNVITLANTGVTNAAGNIGSGTTNSNNYAIDSTRPTATIVVADTTLAVGETSLVTITFSEAVTSFTNADLTIANGTLSAASSSDAGVTWTATLTPTASITDATNVITLANTGVTDAAGNAGTSTTDSNNYAIDSTRPTASIVVADTSLLAGETSLVTITFSEAVTGFTNTDLTVANGTLSAVSSSDGGVTWTATFTPTASITDATNVITLANIGVTDAAGNDGTSTTDSNNYAIDTTRPTASIVVADTALAVGETSLVTITFSEAVTGFTNADLTVANGTLSAVSSSDGGITWTATFTPTASITDATNLITLANTGVTNTAGNAGTGTTDSNNYAIDTTRPTASIVVADTALAIGETSLVTITFSEAVTGFTNADLTVANGTLSAVSSSDGGITWTAMLTPTASITDATNVITLDNTGVTDAAGNAGTSTTDSNNYAIDTTRPTASIVVADTVLGIGETSAVTITFSEAVTGFSNADLTVANGTLSAVSSSDGGITWTATFTPTASITAATNLITLANTGVTDAAGNTGSGTTDSNNYAIDSTRPTASIVVADTALAIGETSLVTITFSEAVTGFTNADLTVANGTLSAVSSSDGGITWTATFTPTASITDATNVITLANTGVTDAAGNSGIGSTDSNNYAIDTTRPTASIIVADTALAIGETSPVTITFSEAVTGFTNTDLTVANGTLSAVSSSDGGITWTATLTPTAGITDATNVITLANTGVTNAAGNAGSGTTDSNNYAIDSTRPTASIVVADTVLGIGETSAVTITFSEAVTGFTNADLTVANGTLSAVSSSDGGITWTATFTPTASITDATNVITLANTGVTNAAGNSGIGSTDSNNYAIDSTRPSITGIVLPADATYLAGQSLDFTLNFSETVTVDTTGGVPRIELTLDTGGTQYAEYVSGSGGTSLVFRFTTARDQLDSNGIGVSGVLDLNGASVRDAAGNDSALALNGLGATTGLRIDAVAPFVSSVSGPADGRYNAGDVLSFTMTTSESLTIDTTGGVPRLALVIGQSTVYASYVSGSGSSTLLFEYAVQAGDNDANGIAISALQANGATLRDVTGNALDPSLSGVTNSPSVLVDTRGPQVTAIARTDTSLSSGGTVFYTVSFSEAVSGLGAEDFGLVSTGSARGTIGAVSQLDATTYRVAIDGIAGSGSLRLDLTASGSGITDLAGNPLAVGLQGPSYRLDPVHLVLTPEPPPAPTVLPSQPAQEPGSLPSVTFDPMAPIMQLDTPTLTAGMPGARSMPWATLGTYIDLGSDIGGRGLQSMPDLGSFHLQPSAPLSISLPVATFTHSDRGAQVSVDLRLADGRPLPAWLKFDALTGTLTGQPPAGTSGRLQIEVIARDGNGNRATSQLIIEFERAVETRPVPNILPRALLDRADAPHTTEIVDRAPTTPAGRAALAAQFERYGRAARNAERAALLQHLRSASSTPHA